MLEQSPRADRMENRRAHKFFGRGTEQAEAYFRTRQAHRAVRWKASRVSASIAAVRFLALARPHHARRPGC